MADGIQTLRSSGKQNSTVSGVQTLRSARGRAQMNLRLQSAKVAGPVQAWRKESKYKEFEEKYANMTRADVQKAIEQKTWANKAAGIEDETEEIKWLKEYGVNTGYSDVASYDEEIASLDKQIQQAYIRGQKINYDSNGIPFVYYTNQNEITELESKKSNLERGRSKLQATETVKKNYEPFTQAADFEEKAVPDNEIDDPLYQLANNTSWTGSGFDYWRLQDDLALYEQLRGDEKKLYLYLANEKGVDTANQYFDTMRPLLNERKNKTQVENVQKFADSVHALDDVLTVGSQLADSMIMAPKKFIGGLTGDYEKNWAAYDTLTTFTNTIRTDTAQDLSEAFNSEAAGFVYNTVMSIGDMVAAILVSKGIGAIAGAGGASSGADAVKKAKDVTKGITQIIMSSGAATQTMTNARERGLDGWQISALGLASAGVEAITEKYSLDALLSDPKNVVAYIAKNIGTEAAEEATSNVLNLLADEVIAGNESQIKQEIGNLMASGVSYEDATQQVLLGKLQELGLDALGGALSGGIMSGGSVAYNHVTTAVRTGSEYLKHENGHSMKEAIAIGLSNAKSTDAYRAAKAIEAKYNKKDPHISAYEVGRMVIESSTPQAARARQVEALVLQSAQENGVDSKTAEEVAFVASRFGRVVGFNSAENMKTVGKDGQVYYESGRYDPNTGMIALNAAAKSEDLVNYVLKHELAHSVERTKLGQQLEQIVRSSMGAEFDAAVQAKLEEYQNYNKKLDEPGARHEVVAQWLGKNLYRDGFAQAVVNGDAKVGNVILRALDQARLALGGTQKSRTAANIAIVERLFMRALQQSPALDNSGGVQYSIGNLPQKNNNNTKNSDISEGMMYNSNWESYELTAEFVTKVPYDERHTFLRSLANKTNGMKQGEHKNIIIFTDKHVYFYEATGYMNGSIEKVRGFGKKINAEIKAWRDFSGSVDASSTTLDSWTQDYGSGRGRDGWDNAANGYTGETGQIDDVDVSAQGSDPIGYIGESDGDFGLDENPMPGSWTHTDDGRVFKVNDDGITEDIQFSNIETEYANTKIFGESPPSQDGAGFFDAQNSTQSSFEGSDEIAEAVALMEQENVGNNGEIDYSALEKYDQRAYTNHGWIAVNHVLTGNEQAKLYSQWADATENRYKYPKTPRGETILTVGDRYGDADALVFISGSNQNPIISEVVRIAPEDVADVSWIRQQLIDGEVQGDVYSRTIIRSAFGQGVLVSKQNGDFASYRELQDRRTQRHGSVVSSEDHFVGPSGEGNGAPNLTRNRADVNTNFYEESPPSQDGAGFFDAQNGTQSSFEGSDEIAEAVALMERERAEKSTAPVEENDTLPLSRQSPTAPLTRGAEGEMQQGDAGTTPVTNIPSPLESGRVSESTVSQAQTVDELTAEIGDEAVYRRMYYAAQIDRPPATLDIDGRTVNTTAYMDELYVALPDDDLQLTAYLKEREAEKAAQVAERFARGETDTEWTEVDLQILTARSKLEWSELGDSGESGSKTRLFYEQRLKGRDVNKAHEEELLEILAGRSETYSPIANVKTLEKAQNKLRNAEYQTALRKRILRYKPNDLFNAVDAAAAQVMINDARNDGDLELYADLVQGLSRKGTELGRAVQVLSMQRRMTPEGTLKAAQRTLRSQADRAMYDGANEDLDVFAEQITDAIERAAENKVATTSGDDQRGGESVRNPMTRDELTEALAQDITGDNSPYITADEIRGILERAVESASDIPDQLKRYLKKRLGSDMGTLAQRIAKLHEAGHLNDMTMRRVMEETLHLPTLTDEDVKTLTGLVNALNDAPEGSAQQLEATEDIYRFLGEKLIVTKLDTLQSWRKFGMLLNAKTHLRNFGSNAVFAGVDRIDGAMATWLERVLIPEAEKRTAAFGWSFTEQGQQIRPAIEKSLEKALLKMRGQGQKYEVSNGVLNQYRKAFGKNKFGETLNTLNEKNSQLLEWEDAIFFKAAYTNALGQIMVARGLTEVNSDVENIAYKRAVEAVFRGENAMTNVLASIKRYQNSTKLGHALFGHAVDVAIPFSKTPANIAYQAVEHSPIGLAKGAWDILQVTQGKSPKTMAEAINLTAKGFTGTVLLGIGMLLGSLGLFVTGFGKTEKERAADELAGIQENAFRFGNVTISLDWLQPAASPLIVGASIAQRLKEDGLSLGSVFGAAFDGTDSLFEMTMLQSLYDVLGGYEAGASASVASVAENLLSQSVPTVLGQVARAVDPVQRKANGESALSPIIGNGTFAKVVQRVLARIPGLTYLLEPELDVWGNTVYRTGKASTMSGVLNALQQFILPANVKIATGDDEISQIVMELYNSNEEQPGRALPTAITREKAAELGVSYEDVNRLLGQNQHAALLAVLSDREKYTVTNEITRGGKTVKQKRQKYWSDMTDEERLQVLEKVYQAEKDNITDPDGEYYDEIVRRMN